MINIIIYKIMMQVKMPKTNSLVCENLKIERIRRGRVSMNKYLKNSYHFI